MNQQAQQMQMNIDLKNTEKVEFDGNVLVQEAFVLRKVSKFVTGQSEDGIMPIPVYFSVESGKIIKETLPKDLYEEYEGYSI
jgi:hypothetical protein